MRCIQQMIATVLASLLLAVLVTPPVWADDPAPARDIRVHCDAPATNHAISIRKVWRVGGELWVVSEISQIGDIGGGVITPIEDSVTVQVADGFEARHFIVGRTWNWWKGVEAEFIDGLAALIESMEEDGIEIDSTLYDADE